MRKAIMALAVCVMFTGWAAGQGEVFRGRVIARVETSEILVSLERQTGQIVAQAYTDSRGIFQFRDVSTADPAGGRYLYLVVEHEGYEPYRERLDPIVIRAGGGGHTIYLEPEGSTTGGLDGTAVDLGQLLADIPDEAVEEYERAQDDIEDEDHDDAVERLERTVALAPDYYDAWIDLGGQLNELERYDDAKRAYEQAGEVNPNGALAFVNLGALYYQEGERHAATENAIEAMGTFAEAHVALERAIQLDPISVAGRFYLGAVLYRLAEFDSAEAQFQTAIDIAGEHSQARLMLINVYNRQRRYDAALEQANLFIDENPDAAEREAIERVRSQLEGALGQ